MNGFCNEARELFCFVLFFKLWFIPFIPLGKTVSCRRKKEEVRVRNGYKPGTLSERAISPFSGQSPENQTSVPHHRACLLNSGPWAYWPTWRPQAGPSRDSLLPFQVNREHNSPLAVGGAHAGECVRYGVNRMLYQVENVGWSRICSSVRLACTRP